MTFEEPNHYIADTGKVFKRLYDNFIMGEDLYLYDFIDGTPDVISNYEEITTPEDYHPVIEEN